MKHDCDYFIKRGGMMSALGLCLCAGFVAVGACLCLANGFSNLIFRRNRWRCWEFVDHFSDGIDDFLSEKKEVRLFWDSWDILEIDKRP